MKFPLHNETALKINQKILFHVSNSGRVIWPTSHYSMLDEIALHVVSQVGLLICLSF